MNCVVIVEISGCKLPVAVLSNRSGFAAWREWFKRTHISEEETITSEGSDHLMLQNNRGTLVSYYPHQTLLDPHVSGA